MSRTCGRCKGSGYVYGKLSVWDMAQGRGSNYGEYPCPVCQGTGNNPNWLETYCNDCHAVIEYHIKWTHIPDLCPDCRERRKNQWQERPCKHCHATIRYNTTWTNIPEYCKDCNQWLEKPCNDCGKPVRYKVYWDNPPNYCQSCKEERSRLRAQRQGGGSSEPNNQNSQARNAINEVGLNKYQQRKFHEALQREGGILSYQELVSLAYDIKTEFGGYR